MPLPRIISGVPGVRHRAGLASGIAGLLLAACDSEPNPTSVSASGATLIQIREGTNCYDSKCFQYDASRGRISVSGRQFVSPPAGVSLASGAITPADFSATFQAGMRARGISGSNR